MKPTTRTHGSPSTITARGLWYRAVSRVKRNTLSISRGFQIHHLGRSLPAQRRSRSSIEQLGRVIQFFLTDVGQVQALGHELA